MHQMPLVLFTVLIQASVGLLLFTGLCRLRPTGTRIVAPVNGLDAPLILLWGLFILGIAASFFHLGKPVNAFNVLRGVSNGSPLSMEMICVCAFGLLTFLYTLMVWKGGKAQSALLAAAILAGLALSYAIANVYVIATVPLWDSAWTFTQFFASVLALGVTGILFMMSRTSGPAFGAAWKKWNTAAIALLLCLTVSTALYMAWSSYTLGLAGADAPRLSLPVLRAILQAVGLFLLILAGQRENDSSSGLYAAVFLCIFGSEIAGRVLFYNLQQVSGMLQIFAY